MKIDLEKAGFRDFDIPGLGPFVWADIFFDYPVAFRVSGGMLRFCLGGPASGGSVASAYGCSFLQGSHG